MTLKSGSGKYFINLNDREATYIKKDRTKHRKITGTWRVLPYFINPKNDLEEIQGLGETFCFSLSIRSDFEWFFLI